MTAAVLSALRRPSVSVLQGFFLGFVSFILFGRIKNHITVPSHRAVTWLLPAAGTDAEV